MSLWSRIFMRNHLRDCAVTLASNPARDLALIGVDKRRKPIRERAAQIRRELRLPPSPALRAN